MKLLKVLILLLFCLASSCNWYYGNTSYREYYKHLRHDYRLYASNQENSKYYIVFLVDARHLDYTNCKTLIKTLAKQPNQNNVESSIGHAWIYLRGIVDGKEVIVEGGHSGETGRLQPKYFDGVMNYVQYGYSDPTEEQKEHYFKEPNPIKYLWAEQKDGFFQKGSGGHRPSFAAKINITKEEFESILNFTKPQNYHYSNYSFTCNQCVSFVNQIAALIGLQFDDAITIKIEKSIKMHGKPIFLWQDKKYSQITFASTDLLEKQLMQMVKKRRANCALNWYLKNKYKRSSRIGHVQKRIKKWLGFTFL